MDRFPCGLCRLQAYCFCPCTLGLSLLSMRKEAKEIERGTSLNAGETQHRCSAVCARAGGKTFLFPPSVSLLPMFSRMHDHIS